ncbi:MAG: hypothetical protein MH204_03470, partial [Fimbriimonadaceae bacterium]|nr:hypothetical protein [Fimbriimonadaceae bacterium]
MMRHAWSLGLISALALAGPASAQTFDQYLKLRGQFGIKQASGAAALETFVGERVMEVRGTVKGAIGNILILENPSGGPELYVQADE